MNSLTALELRILNFLSRVLSRSVLLGTILNNLITKVNTQATTTTLGTIELATTEEAILGEDSTRAMTPVLTAAKIKNDKGYLEWIAYLTQTGTSNPVATVIKDDTAGETVPFSPSIIRADPGVTTFYDNGPWLDPGVNEPVKAAYINVVSATGYISGEADVAFGRVPIIGLSTTGEFGFGMVLPATMACSDVWAAYVHIRFFLNDEEE